MNNIDSIRQARLYNSRNPILRGLPGAGKADLIQTNVDNNPIIKEEHAKTDQNLEEIIITRGYQEIRV